MTERDKTTLKRIRTGSFERRLSLTRTGLLAGTRYMAQSASSLLLPRARRAEHRRAALGAQQLAGKAQRVGQVQLLLQVHRRAIAAQIPMGTCRR